MCCFRTCHTSGLQTVNVAHRPAGVQPEDQNEEHGPRNVDPASLTSSRLIQQSWEQDQNCDMGLEPEMAVEIAEIGQCATLCGYS